MSPLIAYRDAEETAAPAGPARAVILLLALGAEGAGRLLKHLHPDEIRDLKLCADQLPTVSREQIDALVEEFQEQFRIGPALTGPARQMQDLLEASLSPELLTAIMEVGDVGGAAFEIDENMFGPPPSVWDEVEKLEGAVLAGKLAQEHPQVVALLLTRISSPTASAIARHLEARFRNEVMRRMLALKPLAPPMETLFEEHVRLAYLPSAEAPEEGGSHILLADIMNLMDKQHSEALIESIRESQPRDAEKLQSLLFAFEDVAGLTQKARLVLFDQINAEVVTKALREIDGELKEAVLSALGARTRRMVEAELGQASETPSDEIIGARRIISSTALRLAGEGRIQLRPAA